MTHVTGLGELLWLVQNPYISILLSFQLNNEDDVKMRDVKGLLMENLVLAFHDLRSEFLVDNDQSDKGFGAVLRQTHRTPFARPPALRVTMPD